MKSRRLSLCWLLIGFICSQGPELQAAGRGRIKTNAGSGTVGLSFQNKTAEAGYAVVKLPENHNALALAEGGVVLIYDNVSDEMRRWIGGAARPIASPPAIYTQNLSYMNRRGDVIVRFSAGDDTYHALVSKANTVQLMPSGLTMRTRFRRFRTVSPPA